MRLSSGNVLSGLAGLAAFLFVMNLALLSHLTFTVPEWKSRVHQWKSQISEFTVNSFHLSNDKVRGPAMMPFQAKASKPHPVIDPGDDNTEADVKPRPSSTLTQNTKPQRKRNSGENTRARTQRPPPPRPKRPVQNARKKQLPPRGAKAGRAGTDTAHQRLKQRLAQRRKRMQQAAKEKSMKTRAKEKEEKRKFRAKERKSKADKRRAPRRPPQRKAAPNQEKKKEQKKPRSGKQSNQPHRQPAKRVNTQRGKAVGGQKAKHGNNMQKYQAARKRKEEQQKHNLQRVKEGKTKRAAEQKKKESLRNGEKRRKRKAKGGAKAQRGQQQRGHQQSSRQTGKNKNNMRHAIVEAKTKAQQRKRKRGKNARQEPRKHRRGPQLPVLKRHHSAAEHAHSRTSKGKTTRKTPVTKGASSAKQQRKQQQQQQQKRQQQRRRQQQRKRQQQRRQQQQQQKRRKQQAKPRRKVTRNTKKSPPQKKAMAQPAAKSRVRAQSLQGVVSRLQYEDPVPRLTDLKVVHDEQCAAAMKSMEFDCPTYGETADGWGQGGTVCGILSQYKAKFFMKTCADVKRKRHCHKVVSKVMPMVTFSARESMPTAILGGLDRPADGFDSIIPHFVPLLGLWQHCPAPSPQWVKRARPKIRPEAEGTLCWWSKKCQSTKIIDKFAGDGLRLQATFREKYTMKKEHHWVPQLSPETLPSYITGMFLQILLAHLLAEKALWLRNFDYKFQHTFFRKAKLATSGEVWSYHVGDLVFHLDATEVLGHQVRLIDLGMGSHMFVAPNRPWRFKNGNMASEQYRRSLEDRMHRMNGEKISRAMAQLQSGPRLIISKAEAKKFYAKRRRKPSEVYMGVPNDFLEKYNRVKDALAGGATIEQVLQLPLFAQYRRLPSSLTQGTKLKAGVASKKFGYRDLDVLRAHIVEIAEANPGLFGKYRGEDED